MARSRKLSSSGSIGRGPSACTATAVVVLLRAISWASLPHASYCAPDRARPHHDTRVYYPDAAMGSERALANCPSYYLLGAQKCGTTSLTSRLHRIFPGLKSRDKELHVFDRTSTEGILRNGGLRMEGSPMDATPAYLKLPAMVAPRIRALCHHPRPPKFIVTLCDPADRSWSHYRHRVLKLNDNNYTSVELESAFTVGVREQVRELRACLPMHGYTACGDLLYGGWKALTEAAARALPHGTRNKLNSAGVVGGSLYTEQLEAWFEHFPREDFLVLDSRRALTDLDWLIGKVSNFTGLLPGDFKASWLVTPHSNSNTKFSSATLHAPKNAMNELRAFFAEREGWKEYMTE